MLGVFKITLRLRNWYVFGWQSREILSVFITVTLKQVFWKTKAFFKKLECFVLVESPVIESPTFPIKTALSKANVKTCRIRSIKSTYHKGRDFAPNYFIFSKKLVWIWILFEGVFNPNQAPVPQINSDTNPPPSPLSMLFASIWDNFLAQASMLLLFQYAAILSRGTGLKVDYSEILKVAFSLCGGGGGGGGGQFDSPS